MNVLALCSGVGGLELGVQLAVPDARTVCYVEGEAYAAAVLVSRMADETLDEAPVWSDLRTFDGKPWRGVVDLVTAGYPCQPFSVAGRRRGADDPRHLWPHVARIIGECGPSAVFLENVGGHLRLGFREVAEELRGMGYSVAAGLFTAAEVGAPHRRERLFALAVADANRRGRAPVIDAGGCEQKAGRGEGDIEPCSGGEGVGHADLPRLEGRGRPERGRADELPAWPPGPEGDWSDVPRWLWPAVEPGLRGLADGLAPRLDRLRACGNGVVPLVAAYAFRTLAEALR